jgi:RNA polymerase sigma-70 factor (ECF subfamily)
MPAAEPNSGPSGAGPARFATTHWSLVLAARDRAAPEGREALAGLCGTYWYPLYAFVRRQGYPHDHAQDLTQEFFARLLERDYLQAVDRAKGRFRSFLLAACKHFLTNERDRSRAAKRGGGRPVLSLDLDAGEARYRRETASSLTPEKLFERRWALTVLDRVLARLRDESARAGKGELFEKLKTALTGEKNAARQAQLAEELGMSPGAVKTAVHRLRRRYRALLREEIAQTLDDPAQVEEEIRDLFAALGP